MCVGPGPLIGEANTNISASHLGSISADEAKADKAGATQERLTGGGPAGARGGGCGGGGGELNNK